MVGRIGFRGYTADDLVEAGAGAITLSPTNIIDGELDFTNCSYLSWKKYYESPEIMVKAGDVVLVKTASVGKCALVRSLPKETTVNPQFLVFKNIEANSAFFTYILQDYVQCFLDSEKNGSTISTISQQIIGNFKIMLPPRDEQDAIVRYLDAATSKIDKAIAMQQKMIDLLNERKQIIIQNAVTKGLDENVEMMDSGVEWIGMIPKHWKVRRGKFLFRVVNEYSTTGQEELLTVSDRTGITPRSMKNVNMFMSDSLIGYKKCQKGDICSNIMWMWHGAVGVTEYNGVISPSYGVYRQITFSYDNKYLDYMLRLPRLVEVYGNCSTGLTESRLRLYPDDFMNLQFIVPPLEEQKSIVLQIQKQIIAIEKSIENAEKLITLLQERKQIIINEVVTGKVKVL